MPLPSGLVAAYGLEEGSGTTTADSSGNSNNGTISGATWEPSGKYGRCLTFDGVNDYVSIADAASLDLTSGVTLCAWVYPAATPTGWPTVLLKEDPAGDFAYAIYGHGDQNAPNFSIGGFLTLHGTATLPANQWSHVAGTFDGTTHRLYVNGSQVASRNDSGSIPASTGPLKIGDNDRFGDPWNGRIDSAQVYNRALSAAEITTAMNTPVNPTGGAISKTQASDSASAAGAVSLAGSVDKSQAANTATGAGALAIAGTLAKSQASDTVAGVGSAAGTGSLNKPQSADSVSAAGAVALAGSLGKTQAGDMASGVGAAAIVGSFAKTQAGDTFAGSGLVGAASGVVNAAQQGDMALGAGAVALSGSLAKIQNGHTASATGAVVIAGSLTKPAQGDGASVVGAVAVSGSLAKTQAGDVLSAVGTREVLGSLSKTQAGDALSSAGALQQIQTIWYRPKKILLAEVKAYDPDTSTVVTWRFSDLLGYDNGGIFYKPRIEHPAYMRRDASSVLLGGRAAQSYGELTLFNTDGELNGMADDYFDGREYKLLLGDEDAAYASFQTVLVATVESVAFSGSLVSVRFRDRTAALDVPFSSVQYAGSNSLPNGLEGTADDIKGQYKPRIFGRIALMQPILVNTSKLIYQFNHGAVDALVNAFDAGAYLGRESDYVDQSDMENSQPSPNYFRAWPAGGYVRMGSSPFGQIAVSVAEKWTHTQITSAGIILRILQELGWTGADYVAADFTTLDQKCAGPVGVLVEAGETVANLIDRICATVGAWWGFDQLNRFRIGRLDAPAAPVLTITDENIKDGQIDRVAPSEQAIWQTTVQADRNYAVQDKRGMAGVVGDDRIAWLSAETRDQKAVNNSVKTWRLLAQDKVYPSLFCGISQAQAEATRRLSLLSGRRDVVTVTLCDPMGYINVLDIGATVRVQTNDIGYGSGRDMVVIGIGPNYKDDVLDLILWG